MSTYNLGDWVYFPSLLNNVYTSYLGRVTKITDTHLTLNVPNYDRNTQFNFIVPVEHICRSGAEIQQLLEELNSTLQNN